MGQLLRVAGGSEAIVRSADHQSRDAKRAEPIERVMLRAGPRLPRIVARPIGGSLGGQVGLTPPGVCHAVGSQAPQHGALMPDLRWNPELRHARPEPEHLL